MSADVTNKQAETDSDGQYKVSLISSKLPPPIDSVGIAEQKTDDCEVNGETAILPIAKVRLEVENLVAGEFYALLDTGAQPNLVNADVIRRWRIPTTATKRTMFGVQGKRICIRSRVKLRIKPWFDSAEYIDAEFLVLPSDSCWKLISTPIGMIFPSDQAEMKLANPEYGSAVRVQLILGVTTLAKCLSAVLPREMCNVSMLDTTFGIVIMGSCPISNLSANVHMITDMDANDQLERALTRLWQLDQIPEVLKRSTQESLAERIFVDSCQRDSDGRFRVAIPIKANVSNIGESRGIALQRFYALERKLEADIELRKKYVDFMLEYDQLGHMKLVDRSAEIDEIVYFIPHHCVKPKFRVVFDGSCKTDQGISLNDIQLVGEKLQFDLADINMRFRRYPIAVMADIKMMFRQIGILPEYWNLQKIFWRANRNEPLREYWLTVVTYGLASSPHNAVRALVQCGREAEREFPSAARAILRDFYMDDMLSGAEDENEAFHLAQQVDKVLLGGGFELRKWQSNSSKVRSALKIACNEPILLSDEEGASVLGLKWSPVEDTFSYSLKLTAECQNMSKRKILSQIAQLYDPQGYIGPVTIVGRMIMQEIWKAKIEWDDCLPVEINRMWLSFWGNIGQLEKFKIPRWIGTTRASDVHLHGFADASSKAYGAAIYVQLRLHNQKYVANLLFSKSRVAPLKTVSIPRLELSAMELLSRLMLQTVEKMGWKGAPYTLWTDSTIALHWIHKEPYQCETFVANRIASIQNNSSVGAWRHVSTTDNPADFLTRGMSAAEIVKNRLWLNGPAWLSQPEENWPKGGFIRTDVSREVSAELKINIVTELTTKPLTYFSPSLKKEIPLNDHTNSLDKLINVTAYVFRFINRLKTAAKHKNGRNRRSKRKRAAKPVNGTSVYEQLTEEERAEALRYQIRSAQAEYYKDEIAYLSKVRCSCPKSKLSSLKPVLDSYKILRVGGRIAAASSPHELKHPAIIPRQTRFSRMLIYDAHRKTRCGGVQLVSQVLRAQYWIPRMRDEVRRYIHKCVSCARFAKRLGEQMMADLPDERVQQGKPFLHSGVDYAGPFEIRQLDKKGIEIIKRKCWIAVFVCLKTRAVHIDMVSDLTAVAFIACYERFVARRGRCAKMFSDNGTTFVGAYGAIRSAYDHWNTGETAKHLELKRTEWHFSSPAAPHQGGIYEAAVKSMKHHLVRVVSNKSLTYEQLVTLLSQIEAILNSRPMYPLTDDPGDMQALTPAHFLVGEPLVLPLPFDVPTQSNATGVKLWRERQTMLKNIWVRWENEFLTSLQQRKKWRKEKENFRIGQLVVIKSENHPPSQWALGRISQVFPGKDGLVRNVKIKTANGELLRAIQKVCIIPMDTDREGVLESS